MINLDELFNDAKPEKNAENQPKIGTVPLNSGGGNNTSGQLKPNTKNGYSESVPIVPAVPLKK